VYKLIKSKLLLSGALLLLAVYSLTANSAKLDPTSPLGQRSITGQAINEKALILETIIHGDGVHTAIINGQVLQTYDTIGEYKLTAINDKSVVLRNDTERLKLYVFKDNIVKISVVK